jgi:adenylate cyclase, class 2
MNGHETEVKFHVQNLRKIELRLQLLKAQLIQARTHEKNLRFDSASNELRSTYRVLRLREDEKARFTFKGPSIVQDEGILSRREIEFVVEDFNSAKEFLEALGYRVVVFYEKFRATYKLYDTHIMLDELPYGEFVEIEGEDVKAIHNTANLLGLNWNAAIKAGYHALFERVAEKFNLEPSQLSFPALNQVKITAEDLGVEAADKYPA